MFSAVKFLSVFLILILSHSAFAKLPKADQEKYEMFFMCIKRLVPPIAKTTRPLITDSYEKAKSYLEMLSVYGHSSKLIATLSDYCLLQKTLPEQFQSIANQDQVYRVVSLLRDYQYPQMRCKRLGYDQFGGSLIAVSLKLHGAKCNTNTGYSWFQFMPGAGIGIGVGGVHSVSGGDYFRNGDEAWDDSGSSGVRVVGAYIIGLTGSFGSSQSSGSSGPQAVSSTGLVGGGAGLGVGAGILYEGQLSFEVYRRPLRVDYLFARLGIDPTIAKDPDLKLW